MGKSSFLKRGEILTVLTLLGGLVMLAGAFTATQLSTSLNQTSRTSAQSGTMGCIETDGGKNPNVGGAVIATFPDPLNNGQQRQETYKDTCQPSFGSVPILTEYYCDNNVRKQEDLPCTYQAGAGRCTTDSAGFGKCESGLPTVQVVSPGVPTPTAAYTYPPSQQHYIQSVEIVSVTRTQGTFRINGCTGTQNSGQSNAKFWVDGVMVRQPPEYADFVFNRGFPNDCETKTVTVYFNNLTDSQLCSGFGLIANFFYFKNNGTKSNPFNVPPQSQYCPATATPIPPTLTPVIPSNTPIPSATPTFTPSPTRDPRCGQPGNPACPTNTPPPTSTPVPTATLTPTTVPTSIPPTQRPSPTSTPTPRPTATSTPSPTRIPPSITPSATATPSPTPLPPTSAVCPYTAQPYIEGPSGMRFSQITFSSSSGGGAIAFNASPVDVGGGRQRVTLPVATYNVSRNAAVAVIRLNTSSIPAGYRIANANCINNNSVQSCQNWSENTIIISLACNANNLYGWHLERIPCGQPGNTCPSNTPVPSATPTPQYRTYQLDIQPQGGSGDDRTCWVVWNTRSGVVNARGGGGVDCSNHFGNASSMKVKLKLTRSGQSNINFDYQVNDCSGASDVCERRVGRSHAGTISTNGEIQCTWNNQTSGGGVSCQVLNSGTPGGPAPTTTESCDDSQRDETGACNPACCGSSNQCPSGQACIVSNGFCRSGNSCGPANAPRQSNIDVNNDGVVSVGDFLQQIRSGKDLNNDGRINVLDLTLIMQDLGTSL